MRDDEKAAAEIREESLEQDQGLEIKIVCRLIQDKKVWVGQEGFGQHGPASLPPTGRVYR